MNLHGLAAQDIQARIYGVVLDGMALKFEKGSPFLGLTPVLLKGWGWKEVCVAVRERRVLLLSGSGDAPEGCGWLAPVKMWTVDRGMTTLALDLTSGSIDQLLQTERQIGPHFDAKRPKDEEGSGKPQYIDEETAKRFQKFVSDESLFNATAWVAHQSNNEL